MIRVPLPAGRELVVDQTPALTTIWIHDIAANRCSTGPLCLRPGEDETLASVLAGLAAEAERSGEATGAEHATTRTLGSDGGAR